MNKFLTISGWLAVPQDEYNQLLANSMCDNDFLYCELKELADARNDWLGTDLAFKRAMGLKAYRISHIDFIIKYYAIRQFYHKTSMPVDKF